MEPTLPADAPAAPKLLDQVRACIRVKHYSIRTENQYVLWIRRFILFHGKRHPRELGAEAVEAFLSDLAVNGRVAAATQCQALSALLFLYRGVLEITLPWLDNVTRAKPSRHLPGALARWHSGVAIRPLPDANGCVRPARASARRPPSPAGRPDRSRPLFPAP